ncbi:MAG: DUF4412 domain-containing protein [Vicinamibacterales bacterium]
MTTRVLICAMTLLSLPGLAFAQFEGVVVLSMFGDGGKPAQELTQSIKGPMMRMDMATAGNTMSMIVNATEGTMVTLMPAQKMYMSMNMKAMAERLPGAKPATPPKITKTDETETIAGHRCEHYVIDSERQDMDICLARDLGAFTLGLSSPMGVSRSPMPQMPPGFEQLATEFKDGAFPLKMERIDGTKKTTVMMVKTIEAKRLDAALFQVPPDYKQFQLPQYPR